MKSPLFARHRAVSLTLSLVPAFFVMEHVGPEGFPEAQGCSGSGAGVAPPQTATIRRQPGSANVEVASDAFFLIDSYTFTPLEPGSIEVIVTTLEGAEVPGAVQVLSPKSGQGFYSWSADAPLAVGTKLKATVTPTFGAAGVPDQALLEVVGAPTELAPGTLKVETWIDFRHGVGSLVTCGMSDSSCSFGRAISVPGAEQSLHAAKYAWSPASTVTGFVAWEVSVERALPVEAGDYLQSPQTVPFFGAAEHARIGTLPFPEQSQEYCAVFKVRDLRSDEEEQSKLCAEPGKSSDIERDYALDQCTSPPTPGLTEAWCLSHLGSNLQECAPYDPSVKTVDPMPQQPDDPQVDDHPDLGDDTGARTSNGCQTSPGAASGASFGLLAVAAVLGGFLRRRRAAR